MRALGGLPPSIRLCVAAVVCAGIWAAVNWGYQVARKPSELFFPVSDALHKTPAQTWESYAPLFRRHATDVISPELLAALAQVEGSGNPVARTYWRWALTSDLFGIYRPASSAVGMYQITDGTFSQARRYCIRDHRLAEEGPWHDWRSCWFNGLYTRVVPSHAIELTSAWLHRQVMIAAAGTGARAPTLEQQQRLAAIVHLCGAGAGRAHARRGYALTPGQRCGAHDTAAYLRRIDAMMKIFAGFAAAGQARASM